MSKRSFRGRRVGSLARLVALALLLLFPLVASAAQDKTYRASERNVAPPVRQHVLDLLASPNENSRQGLDEDFGPLRLARFLLNPEAQPAFDGSELGLSPGSTEYGFQARERDNESGLMFFRARSLDPMTGRFTSRDPVSHSNLYIFPGNNPVNSTDPSGAISSEEADGLRAMAALYAGWGEDKISKLYEGLLWHEQNKDKLARALDAQETEDRSRLLTGLGFGPATEEAAEALEGEADTVNYFYEKITQAKKAFALGILKTLRAGGTFKKMTQYQDRLETAMLKDIAGPKGEGDSLVRTLAELEGLYVGGESGYWAARRANTSHAMWTAGIVLTATTIGAMYAAIPQVTGGIDGSTALSQEEGGVGGVSYKWWNRAAIRKAANEGDALASAMWKQVHAEGPLGDKLGLGVERVIMFSRSADGESLEIVQTRVQTVGKTFTRSVIGRSTIKYSDAPVDLHLEPGKSYGHISYEDK